MDSVTEKRQESKNIFFVVLFVSLVAAIFSNELYKPFILFGALAAYLIMWYKLYPSEYAKQFWYRLLVLIIMIFAVIYSIGWTMMIYAISLLAEDYLFKDNS